MEDKVFSKHGPTIFQQIIVPFIMTGFIVIAALQASNYFFQKSLMVQELKARFSNSLATAAAYFDATYTLPIQRDLKFIENAYAFNYFLSSQKNEILLTKPLAERLFLHFTNREPGIYLSLRFIDTSGAERVVTEGSKRKKKYVSLASAPKDALHEGISVLFSRLKSEKPGVILCEGPFEYQGKWTFLAGTVKSEPEIGVPAGAVIFHCDLTEYFTYLKGYEFYGERVASVTSLDYKLIYSPMGNDAIVDFRKDFMGQQKYRDFYNLAKEIRIGSDGQALINVVFRISPKIFQKETKGILKRSLMFLFLAVFLMIAVVLGVSKKFSGPLVVLINSIKQFAQGDLSARAHVKTTGEIQLLAEAFNQMAGDLNKTTVSRDSLIKEVNERREVEAALRETKEYLESVFTYASAPIVVWDPQLRITRFNRAFEALTGRDAPGVLGKTPDILFPPAQADRSMELIRRAQAGEPWEGVEINIQHAEGSVRTLFWNSAVIFTPDGKTPVATIAQGYDITERKKAEDALHESQQLLGGIVNLIDVRVFWKDKNLVYLGCNAAFAHDAGFADPKDLVGKDDYQMVWHDQADLYRGDDRQIIENGRPKMLIEEPQTTSKGDTITLLTNKVPLRNSEGEIIGVLGTYVDITERKKAEEKEKKQLKELDIFYKASVGREERVIELKKEIEQLKKELGK